MARYIDADEAIRILRGRCISKYPSSFYCGILSSANEIDKMPTADVVEVKHAEWEISSDGYYPYCTNCRYEPPWVGGKDMRTPYCPNCGAKMDGGQAK